MTYPRFRRHLFECAIADGPEGLLIVKLSQLAEIRFLQLNQNDQANFFLPNVGNRRSLLTQCSGHQDPGLFYQHVICEPNAE
jgi:hypothetical protein